MEDGLQNKITNIQVLRFIAAFSVMMVHLTLFGFGIWGVDIFFVISGFIMMYVTEKSHKNFFLKRIIRIIPIYWILTFGVFLVAILKPDLLNNTTADYEHLLKSLFFIPFNKNETGHFPVLFLGWTLNYEMIFYVIFTITIIFFRDNKIIACSSIIILFVLLNYAFKEKSFIFQIYSNTILFEFIFGLFVYYIWKKYNIKYSEISLLKKNILFFLLTLIILILVNTHLPRIISFGIPAFFLVLIFLFFLKNFRFPKIFILLGDASYCLYLIHPYIIQFFYKFLNISGLNLIQEILYTVIIIICTLLISILFFKFIEKPINFKLRKNFIANENL